MKKFYYFLALSPIWGYLITNYLIFAPYNVIGVISFVTFSIILIRERGNLKIKNYTILLIILTLYYLGWMFINSEGNYLEFIKLFIKWEYNPLFVFSILALINNTKFDSQFINKINKIIKITIIVAFLVSLIQLLVDKDFLVPEYFKHAYSTSTQYEDRRVSIFAYLTDNDIGVSFIPLLSIFIGNSLKRSEKKLWIWVLMGSIICILSNSRYVIIGLLIILIQFIIYSKNNISKIVSIISKFGILIILVLLFLVNISNYNLASFYEERISSESALSRVLALEMFEKYYPKYPWLGNGQSLSEEIRRDLAGRSSQIHVGYLSHLVSYGLIGSILLFLFWALLLKDLLRKSKKTKYYGSVFAFIMFLWTNATLVYYSTFTYGLIFAFIYDKYYYDLDVESKNEKILESSKEGN